MKDKSRINTCRFHHGLRFDLEISFVPIFKAQLSAESNSPDCPQYTRCKTETPNRPFRRRVSPRRGSDWSGASFRPDGEFITARLSEVEPAPTRK
jgi:hypothetical protein